MKRIHKISVYGTLAFFTWLAVLQLQLPRTARALVSLAPLLLLVAFGLYMLMLLLYGAATFKSCPNEAKALHQDIARAKADLLSCGYNFAGHAAEAAATLMQAS